MSKGSPYEHYEEVQTSEKIVFSSCNCVIPHSSNVVNSCISGQ